METFGKLANSVILARQSANTSARLPPNALGSGIWTRNLNQVYRFGRGGYVVATAPQGCHTRPGVNPAFGPLPATTNMMTRSVSVSPTVTTNF